MGRSDRQSVQMISEAGLFAYEGTGKVREDVEQRYGE